jgi:uncharacterized RDD family membrane protein YckC
LQETTTHGSLHHDFRAEATHDDLKIDFAERPLRLLSSLIDYLIVLAMWAATFYVLLMSDFGLTYLGLSYYMETWPQSDFLFFAEFIFGMTVVLFSAYYFFYYTIMESSSLQATWGKQILGIYVTDLSGNQVSFGRASVRHLLRIVFPYAILIPFPMMTQIRRLHRDHFFHDRLSGTVVQRRLPLDH